ncbi:MAG: ribbon-helix-helix domain-containing protein [Trueperaceae bacterium]|nr:ribbon-helix-helix domain-containing protein [Trueperaceae bacterium]
MRTIVDLPAHAVAALDRIRARRQVSRAALVREAVERFLDAEMRGDRGRAFGAWGPGEDGLALQRRLRGEWDDA